MTATKTTTNDLYLRATTDIAPGGRYGTSRHPLSTGDTLFCCVDRVAGRSIVRKHLRTTYRLLKYGDQYSKQISRDKAAALLKAEG